MKISEINESLVGKKVHSIIYKSIGTITEVRYPDTWHKEFIIEVKFDNYLGKIDFEGDAISGLDLINSKGSMPFIRTESELRHLKSMYD